MSLRLIIESNLKVSLGSGEVTSAVRERLFGIRDGVLESVERKGEREEGERGEREIEERERREREGGLNKICRERHKERER